MGSIWLHDLDEVLAPAVGDGIVDLILEPGWETASRGSGGLDSFDGWLWHHTVSGPASDGRNDVNYIRYYNPFAPSPICQLYLPRTGVAWITAAGACNHGGRGGPWRPGDSTPIVRRDMANRTLGGTEMANWGDGKEAWPWRQIRAAIECAARISIAEGWTEIKHHLAHKEYCGPGTSQAGRKIDPLGPWENHPDGLWPNNSSWGASQGEISLFRTLVAQRIAELSTPTPPPPLPGGSPVFHIIANAQDAAFRMKGFNDVVAIIGGTPQPVTRENAGPLFGISDGKLTEIVQNPVPTHLETVAWLRAQGIAMTTSQGGV